LHLIQFNLSLSPALFLLRDLAQEFLLVFIIK
jgi:hypothetical protein